MIRFERRWLSVRHHTNAAAPAMRVGCNPQARGSVNAALFTSTTCAMPVCVYCRSGTLCDAYHGIPVRGDGCLKAAAFFSELKRLNSQSVGNVCKNTRLSGSPDREV